MFTLSMGTLILKSAILIYGWLPTHMALVMGAVFFLVNMEKISKKYFDTIKSLYMHQFNSKGFKILTVVLLRALRFLPTLTLPGRGMP